MKKIVVLGGGSAGWLTALLNRRFYPEADITVVESEDIGILGAGEGTVPHFIHVLDFLKIPISDLIKHCQSTLKLGVRFTNWNNDGEDYFHGFAPYQSNKLGLDSFDHGFHENVFSIKQLADGKPIKDILIMEKLATAGKIPYIQTKVFSEDELEKLSSKLESLDNYATYAMHFNARELAKFLRSVAESRNINRIEGKVNAIKTDNSGNITTLILENNNTIPGDFFFDCSGFARVLIGKHYNTEWISYNKHLPLDSAVPFFIPHDNKNIKPETESIAMKYGWIWKIPVQDRYGCGYVFDSSYINGDQALEEAEEYFEMKLQSPKSFKFKAGSYKDTVVKNCMAVGLAQSFVEPLEATSIWVSCENLVKFLQANGPYCDSDLFRNKFNQGCQDRNNEVVNFLYLHYLTNRTDSEFWKNFRTKTDIPEYTNELLELWKVSTPGTYQDSKKYLFGLHSWIQIADGLGLIDGRQSKLKIDANNLIGEIDLSNIQHVVDNSVTHDDFLEFLK